MNRLSVLTILVGSAALAACSSGGGDPTATTSGAGAGAPGDTGPTYYKDIVPIVQKSCLGCHRPGDIAPFALTTYEEARAVAGLMATETKERRMPPWGALDTGECKPKHAWQEDLRLSEADIKTFEDWSLAGAPAGNPDDEPAPYEPPPNELSEKDAEVSPAKSFVSSGESDQFECFVLDPKLTETKYMNGVYFVPGNPKVVHHILLFSDPMKSSLAMAPAGGSYPCFGGSGVQGTALLAGWAPGGVPIELPPNVGTPLAAGSLLVMQIHYHPGGTTAAPDKTTVQLRYSDTPPEYYLTTALIGNDQKAKAGGDGLLPGPNDSGGTPEFRIPAGVKDHTETMVFTLPPMINGNPTPKLWVYNVGAHMHLVGVDQKITLDHAGSGSGEECLLQTPQWDFAWQRAYAYDAPLESLPVFAPGDKLTNRCTYDNTKDNKALVAALLEQKLTGPVDVTLGEETLDEMCLSALGLLSKAP
jgi:hypothetical protein